MTAKNEGEESAAVLTNPSPDNHAFPGLQPGDAVLTNPEVRDQLSGLFYFDNFISEEEQDALVALIDSQPFCEAIHRRQQFWGELYYHTTHDVSAVQPANEANEEHPKGYQRDLQPMQWLVDRFVTQKPFNSFPVFEKEDSRPNQCLVNEYRTNQGISSHFEDTRSFGDAIMTISLINPIYMTLKKPSEATNQCQDILAETRVLLRPRSCLIMSGDSRFRWRHGIPKTKTVPLPEGSSVYRGQQYRRLSLTIRRVLDGRRRAEEDSEGWVRHLEPVRYDQAE